ncbi:hypothetical protein CRYUN_Cryun17cG0002200 [Craigia yunnanensis]
MNELKEEIRQNKIEKRKKREEREKKKKENILRSGTKFQKISNPNTLKKIAKSKQKKLLQVVPDEFVNKKSNVGCDREVGLRGLESKRHMKIVLRWIRRRDRSLTNIMRARPVNNSSTTSLPVNNSSSPKSP